MNIPRFPLAHDQRVVARAVSGEPAELLDDEKATFPDASSLKRRLDVQRGRLAAREALSELLGPGRYPITRGARGEPIFPVGVCGSISHCADTAVAVVCRIDAYKAVGVDLELLADRKMDITPSIATTTELNWLATHSDFPIAILFSAKESVYKAIAPIVGRYIGFQEVELTWSEAHESFLVRSMAPFGEAEKLVDSLKVHVSRSSDAVLTLAVS